MPSVQINQTIPGSSFPGLRLEEKTVSFKSTFNLTLSPLSVRPNRFCFSANMDEDFEVEKIAFNGDFHELPKKIQNQINNSNENLNIKRKAFFLRNEKYFKTVEVVLGFIQKNLFIASVGKSKNYLRSSLDHEIIITLLSAMHLGSFNPSTQHRLSAALTVFYL